MSHFTVLVIGGDVERQLAPYDENMETAPRITGDVTEEEKKRFFDHYTNEEGFEGTFEECYKEHGDGWNCGEWRKNSKGIWQEWSSYNPDSKWDWYQVGGRWRGFFKVKKGAKGELGEKSWAGGEPKKGYADSLLKKDIDFEGQRNFDKKEAIKHFKTMAKLFGGEIPKLDFTWSQLIETEEKLMGGGHNVDYDKLRDRYANQKGNKLKEEIAKTDEGQKLMGYFFTLDDYQCTEEEYGKRAYDNAIVPYAMVVDGVWYQKGKMGWWGMSSGEMKQGEWNEIVNEKIAEAEDDTLISLLDCHI